MDGCTYWIDGWWRSCCDAHDVDYLNGAVNIGSHLDLGLCVIQSAPNPALAAGGVVIGGVMALATTAWWLIKHRGHRDTRH
ncbi:hypothetical protein [Pararhizobium haloflavum]|uniref:hypothetical protein n=1 Tax=Pararhizobium haloflavum TaxID=2037914 RepID=UPI000C17C622|nr:hypothetical protein [Pararhizobium haloflavum]